MLAKLFLGFTEFGKNCGQNKEKKHLTEFGKIPINKTITNNSDKVNENYNNSVKEDKKFNYNRAVARPRFELGSKAPKASMLVRYIRYLIMLPGFPGILL